MNQISVQNDPVAATENLSAPRLRRSVFAVAGVFIALLACGLAAWTFFATQQSTNAINASIASLQISIAAFETTARDTQQSATQRESTLASTLRDLERRVAETENMLGYRATDWLWAEAEYFLSLAQEQLILNRDVGTALAALSTADLRLQRANRAEGLAVRAEIATAIATLRSLQQPDRAGHALKLTALAARADRLPLARAEVVISSNNAVSPEATPTNVVATLWARLTSMIVVRHSSQALPALLAPEQTVLLRLNLQLQLESTRAAMLRNDQDHFAASIRAARDWLAKYFDATDHEVVAAITQLDELAQVSIAWHAPDISAPLQVLRTLRVPSGPRTQPAQKTPSTAPQPTVPAGAMP